MKKTLRVLIIDDSERDTQDLIKELRNSGYDPVYERVENESGFLNAINNQRWDAILTDYSITHFNAFNALSCLRQLMLDIPVIVVTNQSIGEEKASQIIKAGASDYLVKGKLGRLASSIEREIHESRLRHDHDWAMGRVLIGKQEWEATVDAIPELIILTDVEGRIIRVNEAAINRFSTSYLEILGTKIEDLFIDPVNIDQPIPELHGDIQFRDIEGWFSVSSHPIFLEEDVLHGIAYIFHDVTSRKEIENAQIMLQGLSGLGTLVAGIISQELEDPVQEIIEINRTQLDAIRKRTVELEELAKGLEIIMRDSLRVKDIAHGLKRYSQKVTRIMEPHNINDLIHDTFLLVENDLRQREDILVNTQLESDLPPILCDQLMIILILKDLIINSLEAMSTGGEIRIRSGLKTETESVFVEVRDNGQGIPVDLRSKILEPFFTTKEGTGLGLSMVSDIVYAHGGEIEIESEPNLGTVFRLMFPKFK